MHDEACRNGARFSQLLESAREEFSGRGRWVSQLGRWTGERGLNTTV